MSLRIIIPFILLFAVTAVAQPLDSLLPVRGLAIKAPDRDNVDRFITFIEDELAPGMINTLLLRVDYNYAFDSYPNLRDEVTLSKKDVKKLVKSCRELGIRLIPQINMLGHQSWADELGNLLVEYPEFDETPHVAIPDEYEWPNADGLYCKSYCPLHPDVHNVVFALIDEITEVFETDAFHAGMDEVFYIGDPKCPRCARKDKAELFANEVNLLRDHLAESGKELWIWGDRMLDGKTTGLGMWEASENNTHRSMELIKNDVVICDWHYERAEPVAPLFASKGFRVISCPWNRPEVGIEQVDQMRLYRSSANTTYANRFRGVMHTIWRPAGPFLDALDKGETVNEQGKSDVATFRAFTDYLKNLDE